MYGFMFSNKVHHAGPHASIFLPTADSSNSGDCLNVSVVTNPFPIQTCSDDDIIPHGIIESNKGTSMDVAEDIETPNESLYTVNDLSKLLS